MVRLLALLAVAISTLSSFTAAFPTQPGACRLSAMKTATSPHGFAPAAGGTITVSVQPSGAPGTYTFTVNGQGTFTGMLLFAQDNMNGTRFGSFTNIPSGYAPLTTCGDINPASNTLGHNSAAAKNFPVSFTWSDLGYPQPYSAVVSGIFMTDTVTMWFTSSPALFTSSGNAAVMTSNTLMASSTSSSMAANPTMTTSTGSMSTMTNEAKSSMSSGMSNPMMNSSMTSMMSMNSSMSTGMMMSSMATGSASSTMSTSTTSSSDRVTVSLLLGVVVAAFVIALS